MNILFLHADPKQRPRDSETEYQQVEENIKFFWPKNVQVNLNFVKADKPLTTSNFQRYLLEHNPTVLHICGHGNKTGDLLLCNEEGEANPVSASAIGYMFQQFKDLKLVVLSACYSKIQAEEIAKSVPAVVGNPSSIGIVDACKFSAAFYLALGYGRNVEECLNHGKAQILLDNSKASIKDKWLPELSKRPEIELLRLINVENKNVNLDLKTMEDFFHRRLIFLVQKAVVVDFRELAQLVGWTRIGLLEKQLGPDNEVASLLALIYKQQGTTGLAKIREALQECRDPELQALLIIDSSPCASMFVPDK